MPSILEKSVLITGAGRGGGLALHLAKIDKEALILDLDSVLPPR